MRTFIIILISLFNGRSNSLYRRSKDYHTEPGTETYRVVGFYVEPLSIAHQYANDYVWDGETVEGHNKPLTTCPSNPQEHVSRRMDAPPQIVIPGEKYCTRTTSFGVRPPSNGLPVGTFI